MALLLGTISLSACATWAGKPPPCPAPDPYVIEDFRYMVKENVKDPGKFSDVLRWAGEIERFCSGLSAMSG